MKITILGSGTSTGVPQIGCSCEVCTSSDLRDNRMRASAWIETEKERILIDCGPDFREQMLRYVSFAPLDAVLITHEHYDHTGGIDDLRPFCAFGDIAVYADGLTVADLKNRLPYCFKEHKYPGVPLISLTEIYPHIPFKIGETEVFPIQVLHGKLPILGFRIGKMAYITDLKTLPDNELSYLKGVECLIVNALRTEEHMTHQTLDEALALSQQLRPRQTYLIHMSHHIGLHKKVQQLLPEGVFLAYDGMQIIVED